MARILIIDDDALVCRSIGRCVADLGHEVLMAGSLASGLEQAQTGVDVVYLDLGLPDGDGEEVIEALAATPAHPEVVIITGMGGNYGAEGTLTKGAWEYIPKPASPAVIRESLSSVLEYRRNRRLTSNDTALPEEGLRPCGIIGHSAPMQRVWQVIGRAAESEAGVLVLGETGAGKELVAQAIHANSLRRNGPFVVVDCSNLTESLVESVLYGHVKGAFTSAHADSRGLVAAADGGTLFLDEVGELPLSLQKSFLRVLQEHTFRPVGSTKERSSDFRLVAATNRDVDAMARDGRFRNDLLFRLRTVEVHLPPLRERGDDIAELAAFFVKEACSRYGLPEKTLSRQLVKGLSSYAWPGNVRELGNVMEAAVIESGHEPTLFPKHLPGQLRVAFLDKVGRKRPASPAAPPSPREEITWNGCSYEEYKGIRDRSYFQQLMDVCEGDMLQASRLSGLSVASIYRHLALAGISTKNRVKR